MAQSKKPTTKKTKKKDATYKNIMVAIDDSATSKAVLKETIKFYHQLPNCKLRIIHVSDENLIHLENKPTKLSMELQKLIKKEAINLLKSVQSKFEKAQVKNFETKIVKMSASNQKIAENIINEAKSWPADLIIIGTHGRRGVHRFLLGSIAESVVRISPVPVLLIRK
ncbi:MAG: hypothetical protein BGO43_00615 [Gammaproteobacteria bacterium 39-13]|nr:universal stress protein [Gammaproteobacteria bacterium]OJV96759.1 MAG: hypothetical protein BGO43_00615 [Gammaproteobacteria bacterium 39-13]